MSERTNERDVGVGGETSALNFREDTHTGGTNERTNERRRAFLFHIRTVLGSGEDKFGETHRGHKPGRQAGIPVAAGWVKCARIRGDAARECGSHVMIAAENIRLEHIPLTHSSVVSRINNAR